MPINRNDLHLLIIEDNPGDFYIIQAFLQDLDISYPLTHVQTFAEAKSLLSEKNDFQVIFLDLTLPDANGEELVDETVRLAGDIPVIVLTGYDDRDFGIRTLSMGISDYLLKDDLTSQMLDKSITYSIERKRIGIQLKEAEVRRKKHDQEITKAIIQTQEQERLEIGRELHDNVNQLLAASKINLRLAQDEPTKEKANEWIANSNNYISLAIEEIRRLSHQLAPASFHYKSMRQAFIDLLKSINPDNQFTINFNFQINEEHLPADIKLNLFRILQEQLKNILKHSEANKIEITVKQESNHITMRIYDNGKGFDKNEIADGIGLSNMKKRSDLFLGTFELNTAEGKGCQILVRIPLKQEQK